MLKLKHLAILLQCQCGVTMDFTLRSFYNSLISKLLVLKSLIHAKNMESLAKSSASRKFHSDSLAMLD